MFPRPSRLQRSSAGDHWQNTVMYSIAVHNWVNIHTQIDTLVAVLVLVVCLNPKSVIERGVVIKLNSSSFHCSTGHRPMPAVSGTLFRAIDKWTLFSTNGPAGAPIAESITLATHHFLRTLLCTLKTQQCVVSRPIHPPEATPYGKEFGVFHQLSLM